MPLAAREKWAKAGFRHDQCNCSQSGAIGIDLLHEGGFRVGKGGRASRQLYWQTSYFILACRQTPCRRVELPGPSAKFDDHFHTYRLGNRPGAALLRTDAPGQKFLRTPERSGGSSKAQCTSAKYCRGGVRRSRKACGSFSLNCPWLQQLDRTLVQHRKGHGRSRLVCRSGGEGKITAVGLSGCAGFGRCVSALAPLFLEGRKWSDQHLPLSFEGSRVSSPLRFLPPSPPCIFLLETSLAQQ